MFILVGSVVLLAVFGKKQVDNRKHSLLSDTPEEYEMIEMGESSTLNRDDSEDILEGCDIFGNELEVDSDSDSASNSDFDSNSNPEVDNEEEEEEDQDDVE